MSASITSPRGNDAGYQLTEEAEKSPKECSRLEDRSDITRDGATIGFRDAKVCQETLAGNGCAYKGRVISETKSEESGNVKRRL